MVQVADGKMVVVSKLAYAKYRMIHGKFQDKYERIKNVLSTKLASSSSRYTSLVANSLFGLTKEDWDKDNDMWKLKEFEDLLFSGIALFLNCGICVMILRFNIT